MRENVADEIRRRRQAALAGHRGDEAAVRLALADPAETVRATALGALDRVGYLGLAEVVDGLHDPSPVVRRRACDVSVSVPLPVIASVVEALADGDHGVVEAACCALGERGSGAGDAAVRALAEVATLHVDVLCREAAVAALGAIGDPAGLSAILEAARDKPAIRRRAVLALASFEGPEVERVLARARGDRDWQVRQAAEDLSEPLP